MKILASVLIILVNFGLIIACSCINKNEVERVGDLKSSAVIFQGEVISVGEDTIHCMKDEQGNCYETSEGKKLVDRGTKDFTFRVERHWKGIESEAITIQTRLDSCQWKFEKGEKVMVVAQENSYEENKKPFLVDYCDRHLAKPELVTKVFGEGKTFDKEQEAEVMPANLLTAIWQTIISFLS